MLFTIEYTLDSGSNWILIEPAYSGSSSGINSYDWILPEIDMTKAYIRVYESGTLPSELNSSEFWIGSSEFKFTSYYRTHEYKYMCVVKEGEFNDTTNPTFYNESGSFKSSISQRDTTGNTIYTEKDESFYPYTTGIGLYDDSNQLVAYAKFANPIKIQKNMDSVFIIKFDM